MTTNNSRRSNSDDQSNDDWLLNFIANKIETALNDEDGDVSELRSYNFNRYFGKHYGNERDGHSKFTTREVFEAVEWAMPSVLRVFTSNTNAVEFLARNEADEEQAQQETDVANYYIHTENNGFLLLHNWTKDILMFPNGYVKAYVEEKDVVTHDQFSGLTLLDLNLINQNPYTEIVEYESYVQFVEGYGMQELHKVRVKCQKKKRELRIENMPPDEVLIDDSWTKVDLEGCPFVCHRVRKSISDLIKQGYDRGELEALGDSDDNNWNDERVNRLFYEEESPDADDEAGEEGASRMLWVHDISIEADYDDDGIAERRHVVMIGDKIFENEEDDYQPIVSCASIIIPHKHIAMSYIEAVQDLQLIATTVTRQMLDNIYAQTNKRHFFNEDWLLEDNSTMDDYLDARSDAIIGRGQIPGNVEPEITQPITQELLAVIEHVKGQPKLRTGVAPELSLDPSTLQQSTMGAFMGALDQASQRLDMLVRVIAEVGYKGLVGKVHTLLRRFINEPSEVKLRGNWVKFDPSTWQERTKMTVNVGLGFNSSQQKVQLLMGVLGLQKEAMQQNLSSPDKIYNTLERLVEAASIGAASSYFTDPSKPVRDPQTGQMTPWQPPQPQPDAQMILAQAQARALSQEQQRKGQELQFKAQHDMQKLQSDMQKLQTQMQMERDKLQLSREEFEAKYEIDSATGMAKIRETYANIDLKQAQETKTYADAGVSQANARKTDVESSEEVREAQDIIANGIHGAEDEESDDMNPPPSRSRRDMTGAQANG